MAGREPLERLATAVERIADAVEYIARTAVPQAPMPQLKVARSPGDVSSMEVATLRPDEGLMTAILQNVGDADTVVYDITALLGEIEVDGELIGRDNRPHSSITVPAALQGPGVIVQFRFGGQSHGLGALPLRLRIPHHPEGSPIASVLEVQLEPIGSPNGRFEWRVVKSQLGRDHAAA